MAAISENIDQTLKLKDGRTLGYIDLGNKDGKPLFHFHGFPGSRLEATILADRAIVKNIRVICIDRPGMGLSDFKENRTLLDWPDDVVELADALEIDKFAVEGISGGGPYAAACAYKIPDRGGSGYGRSSSTIVPVNDWPSRSAR